MTYRYLVVEFIGGRSSLDGHFEHLSDARDRIFEIEEQHNSPAIVADMEDRGRVVAQNAFY